MALQTVIVHLPEMLYQKIAQRAQQTQRSVEDELVEAVEAGLPIVGGLPAEVADEVAQLAFLTDDELWQAAESTLPETDSERMQALVLKRQRERLTEAELEEAERLRQRQDRNMLIRAKAAALLKERGHDISRLGPTSTAE